ncbi:MAG: prolipoprotein diacylglyceryl transferase [Candidatus Omnitrophica bacterium]|nr:prolipoprotein diacylglyceryl transferase [Candidatus Omnitrophota bacterium]
MHPVLFKIGPFTVYTYGFFVFLGILAGWLFSLKEAIHYNLPKDTISDLIFWTIVWGFIFSRLGYIVTHWDYFLEDWWRSIISSGGFVFYSGLLGGLLFLLFFVRKKSLSLLKTLDLLSPSLALAHSLGRIGCFFYGCCYGKPTSSFLGIKFPPDSPAGQLGQPLIPTQLISSFFLLIIFIILLILRDKKLPPGRVFVSYLLLYGAFRFVIEFYRGECLGYFLSLSIGQWLSLGLILASFFIWLRIKRIKA